MESIYLAERTWREPYRLISHSFVTSRPKSRPIIPPVNTSFPSKRATYLQEPQLRFDDSAGTASPRTPDDTFTSYPSPITVATTPATSPLQEVKVRVCVDVKETDRDVIHPKDNDLSPEAKKFQDLMEQLEARIKRYMEEMIHGRQLDGKLHGIEEGVIVGENF